MVKAGARDPRHLCRGACDPILTEMKELPAGALVLFDGRDLDAWVDAHGQPARWRLEDGALVVEPGRGDLITRRRFSDFRLHLELWLPHMPEATGQDRANSGVY